MMLRGLLTSDSLGPSCLTSLHLNSAFSQNPVWFGLRPKSHITLAVGLLSFGKVERVRHQFGNYLGITVLPCELLKSVSLTYHNWHKVFEQLHGYLSVRSVNYVFGTREAVLPFHTQLNFCCAFVCLF